KRAFSEAFCLEPRLAASASVFRRGELGNNAFKLVIRTRLEECVSVSGELLTEQEWMFVRDKLLKLSSPFQQWPVTQIFAIHVEKIEGTKDQSLWTPPEARKKGKKVPTKRAS